MGRHATERVASYRHGWVTDHGSRRMGVTCRTPHLVLFPRAWSLGGSLFAGGRSSLSEPSGMVGKGAQGQGDG